MFFYFLPAHTTEPFAKVREKQVCFPATGAPWELDGDLILTAGDSDLSSGSLPRSLLILQDMSSQLAVNFQFLPQTVLKSNFIIARYQADDQTS